MVFFLYLSINGNYAINICPSKISCSWKELSAAPEYGEGTVRNSEEKKKRNEGKKDLHSLCSNDNEISDNAVRVFLFLLSPLFLMQRSSMASVSCLS